MKRALLTLVLLGLAACQTTDDQSDDTNGIPAVVPTGHVATDAGVMITPEPNVAVIRQGLQILGNPYPGSYVKVIVGNFSGSGYNAVLFWQAGTNQCSLTVIASPMWQDLVVSTSNAAGSEIAVIGLGQSSSAYCVNYGQTFTMDRPINQGTFQVHVDGSPLTDYVNCSGNAGTPPGVVCNLGEGDDVIDTYSPVVDIWAQQGNDKIRVRGFPGPYTKIHGGEGADCLQWSGSGTMGAYECNQNPPACNPSNLATCDRSTYILGTGCQWIAPANSCN